MIAPHIQIIARTANHVNTTVKIVITNFKNHDIRGCHQINGNASGPALKIANHNIELSKYQGSGNTTGGGP